MSARTFFNLRNTIPGYTFILWSLLLNLESAVGFFVYVMPEIAPSSDIATLFGIVLGFLTLLSGGAIGFLVSQFWFLIYWVIIQPLLVANYLKKKLEKFKVEDKNASILLFNYIAHSFEKKQISSFIARRWDLMNIFGSTIMAILSGIVSGLILRGCVLSVSGIPNNPWMHVNWEKLYNMVYWISALLIVAFVVSLYKVAKQAYEMGILAIRLRAMELGKAGKELRDELPEEYFKSKDNS